MGDLGQPVNTFWQLFFRREGARTWSNQVEATATATNGGLVLAPAGRSLLVGVRPSQLLTFTPLISTADAGRSWSTGLISEGLASRPTALAMTAGGEVFALVNGRGGPELLTNTGGLSSWHALVTSKALAASPLSSPCDPGPLTAVGYVRVSTSRSAGGGPPDYPVIGTSCRRPGVVGIFQQVMSAWQIAGPTLPPGSGQAQVLGLFPSEETLAALIGLSGGLTASGGTSLLAAWAPFRKHWVSSASLLLAKGDRLLSYGATPAGGLFVLVARPGGGDELAVAAATSLAWQRLPPPPPGTTTVAFGPGSTVDALAAGRSVLTVWHLASNVRTWAKSQVVQVAIQYGSSS
jgi:hypothetical protein